MAESYESMLKALQDFEAACYVEAMPFTNILYVRYHGKEAHLSRAAMMNQPLETRKQWILDSLKPIEEEDGN